MKTRHPGFSVSLVMQVILLLLLVFGLMTGCGNSHSKKHRQARIEFDHAVKLIEEAHRGYPGEEDKIDVGIEEYRQRKLAEAADRLEKTLKDLSVEQEAAARRLLASVYKSTARHEGQKAFNNSSELGIKSSFLMSQVSALIEADLRATRVNIDFSNAIDELKEIQGKFEKQVKGYSQTKSRLEERIGEWVGQSKRRVSARNSAVSEAQKIRDKAYTITGKAQYEAHSKAAELEHRAQTLDIQGEELEAKIVQAKTELKSVEYRMTVTQSIIESLESQIQLFEDHQKTNQTLYQQTIADEQNSSSKFNQSRRLNANIDRLAEDYHTLVDTQFDLTIRMADRAIETLLPAIQPPFTNPTELVITKLDLLAAQLAKTRLLADRLVAVSSWGQYMHIVAQRAGSNRLASDQVAAITVKADELQKKHDQIAADAKLLISQAKNLALELASAPAGNEAEVNAASVAAGHAARLDLYSKAIESSRITVSPQPAQ